MSSFDVPLAFFLSSASNDTMSVSFDNVAATGLPGGGDPDSPGSTTSTKPSSSCSARGSKTTSLFGSIAFFALCSARSASPSAQDCVRVLQLEVLLEQLLGLVSGTAPSALM